MNANSASQSKFAQTIRMMFVAGLTAATLTGCYVEVSHEHEADFDTEVHYSSDLTDFATPLLVDAALIPFSLSAETPNMVIDPDAYTSPRQAMSKAVITETTYSYLFDDWDCEYGGFTQTNAEAETTSYSDGYTFVELAMNAQAFDCEVRSRGSLHQVNSDVDYDVTGWYDDWQRQVSSLDASLTGNVSIEFNGQLIEHNQISVNTIAISSYDFSMYGSSRVKIDDGFDYEQASLTTLNNVHFYLGDAHPHQGRVKLSDGLDWVILTFEENGLWREDDDGYETYWRWSELGFQ